MSEISVRSEHIVKITCLMMENNCIRQEIMSPYLGDQQCDVYKPPKGAVSKNIYANKKNKQTQKH